MIIEGKITKEQIKELVENHNLELKDLIDVVIELNGFIGVGLISLGDNLQEYVHSQIKPRFQD